ncbi:MAG: nucleotide exchange factor GrpE [Deltaproteobacteria bacterium]|nr:nucleotide exchange factor GrpE [Deltaproteobacteria bacterium]
MTEGQTENKDIAETDIPQNPSVADSEAKAPEDLTREELIELCKELKDASDRNYDLYLRSQAEMENLKKRNRREKEDWLKYANETLIKSILPTLDNLEKALEHAENENTTHALREGVNLTLKGLKDALSKSGLVEIKAIGESFDPSYHEAVSQIKDDQVKPGTIVEELQKGYLLNDRLIRPAVVVVSKTG